MVQRRRHSMKFRFYIQALSLLVLAPLALMAQTTTATVVGTVTDPSGAAVPAAQVTATNIGTALTRSVQTNDQGEYRIELLPVGEYSLEVNAPRFRRLVRKNIVSQVGQVARVDLPLVLGQASEDIEVTGTPPLLNTSYVALGRTCDHPETLPSPLEC